MFDEYILPTAAVIAVLFVCIAFVKGGFIGLFAALAIVESIRLAYDFIRWNGWLQ